MVKMLAKSAPAKINLFLRVVGKRADGYHELDSVFVPVSLCDQVAIDLRHSDRISIALRCDRSDIPDDDRNLAWRAARAFLDEYRIQAAVSIDLRKRIPAGAGLGGGSSDAGAVLRMLAAMTNQPSDDRLAKVALALGADVPFFLDPRPARIAGVGERISPLASLPQLAIVIAAPPFEVSTAAVFRELKPRDWSGPAPQSHLEALAAGAISSAILVNDLAPVAIARHPFIGHLIDLMRSHGASAAAMSGSGGAVFGIFADSESARRAAGSAAQIEPATRFIATESEASRELSR